MLKETLTACLGQYARQGFTLEAPDDHLLELRYEDEIIAMFRPGAKIEDIRLACEQHLLGIKQVIREDENARRN